jgi:histidyl-tRNA synthetase
LKYDQTVPFARFVVQNQNDLVFPFKRYQIQPVWRADRPGKGRYREFYQCDVDVVGTESLLCEVEFIQIFNELLTTLRIPEFTIRINNRKILSGIAEVIGEADKIVQITVAIDKLDKIGIEKVNEELVSKRVSFDAIKKLQPILELNGTREEKIHTLKTFLASSEKGMKGLEELAYIFNYCSELGINNILELDLTLARGLNYYTGAIFEVTCENFKGSICGGGRYDGLTDQFGLKGMGCAGISFGADRIYDVLEENNLFPKGEIEGLDVFFVNFGEKEERYLMPLVSRLRAIGVSVEVYPTSAKMKKQIGYADSKDAKFVVLLGENEMNSGTIRVKDMVSGDQKDMLFEDFLDKFKTL